MRRPKTRRRKIAVDEKLLALFRAAMPAHQALWREIITGKEVMTDEESRKARAAVYAFNRAADVMPWEHSPLSPRSGGPGSLRDALMAIANEPEVRNWRKFAREWQRQ